MLVKKAYKFRIYPTKEEEIFIKKSFGCRRKIYNLMLADKNKAYKENGQVIMYIKRKPHSLLWG